MDAQSEIRAFVNMAWTMTVASLKLSLGAESLSTSGAKSELVTRWVDHKMETLLADQPPASQLRTFRTRDHMDTAWSMTVPSLKAALESHGLCAQGLKNNLVASWVDYLLTADISAAPSVPKTTPKVRADATLSAERADAALYAALAAERADAALSAALADAALADAALADVELATVALAERNERAAVERASRLAASHAASRATIERDTVALAAERAAESDKLTSSHATPFECVRMASELATKRADVPDELTVSHATPLQSALLACLKDAIAVINIAHGIIGDTSPAFERSIDTLQATVDVVKTLTYEE